MSPQNDKKEEQTTLHIPLLITPPFLGQLPNLRPQVDSSTLSPSIQCEDVSLAAFLAMQSAS